MRFLKSLFSSRRWFALALLATICLSVLLLVFAPQQVSVVHYKLVLTLLAGLIGELFLDLSINFHTIIYGTVYLKRVEVECSH